MDLLRLLFPHSSRDSGASGAEDLRPSLWPWIKPFPHRTSKEFHLHSASIRLDFGLLLEDAIPLGPEYHRCLSLLSLQRPARSHPRHSSVPESKNHSTGKKEVWFHHRLITMAAGQTPSLLLTAGSSPVAFHRFNFHQKRRPPSQHSHPHHGYV